MSRRGFGKVFAMKTRHQSPDEQPTKPSDPPVEGGEDE
jgi:hypothetical protein